MLRPGSVQFPLLLICLPMMLAGAACTREGPAESASAAPAIGNNRPPVVTSARILNIPLSLDSPVSVTVEAEDPEREAVSFRYQWYADGIALPGQTSPTLAPEHLRQGQMVSVELVPADGAQAGKAYRTAAVVVGNTPPKISGVTVTPQPIVIGENVEAQVEASDPDHDLIDLSYRWFRNGVVIQEGDEPFLKTTGFIPQDQIAVEVTARDISSTGNSVRSASVTVGNRPPTIVSMPPASDTTNPYEYTVKVVDLDGDRMAFQLEAAPPGMTIDQQSGRIVWSIQAGQSGTFHVKVIAQDGRGGAAYQEFDLSLAAQAPATPGPS
jgi:Putative Ig domain